MDMTQYLGMFLEESREHLQKLNEALLDLEGSPDNRAILDEIFRSAHTLKGMSATMGFSQVAELTHAMENVLHKIRNGEIDNSGQILDLLFKCVDILDNMVNDINNGGTGNLPVGDLLTELKAVGGQSSNAQAAASSDQTCDTGVEMPAEISDSEIQPVKSENIITTIGFNEYEKNLINQALDQGFECYHLVVNIDPRCVMKSARAFMIFRNMEEIGEILKALPSVQEIEEEKFDDSFDLILITRESQEAITKGLTSITEVYNPEINLISDAFRMSSSSRKSGKVEMGSEETKTPQPIAQPLATNTVTSKTNNQVAVAKPKANQTVRVDTTKLDSLMNLVGELVINKTRMEQLGRTSQSPDLTETLEQMDRITTDLQNVVMKVRMITIDTVFSRFPRMVRDLAKDLGKEIDLIIEGKDTELDRTVIDEIGDPLVHLLRNSIDHGIEDPAIRIEAGKNEHGRIILSARHEGNNVVIEVADDGKGINPDVIKNKAIEKGLLSQEQASEVDEAYIYQLLLQAGFSTAEKVTDVSGRGVGLDAVKSKIESLSGSIHIESRPGAGTTFKIQLPLTLAIIQALLVSLENEAYAIPLSFIAETTSILPKQINKIQDQEVMLLRGDILPLIRLHEVLRVPLANIPKEEEINIVVVRKGDKRVGLIVDTLIGQQEIVIKPLGRLLGNIHVLAGATILGNGQVSLIIDVSGLF